MSVRTRALVDRIDAWLPQTQCTRCGYPRCRVYAEAIARGEADINQCPPGDDVTIRALAQLLNTKPKPLNGAYGEYKSRQVAVIDESTCIGCALCIAACPVDAIVGAAKHMHTVIANECTGCELCVAPCPVDCIAMFPYRYDGARDHWLWPDYSPEQVDRARQRTQARLRRIEHRKPKRVVRRAVRSALSPKSKATIRKEIEAAVKRVRAKKRRQTVC